MSPVEVRSAVTTTPAAASMSREALRHKLATFSRLFSASAEEVVAAVKPRLYLLTAGVKTMEGKLQVLQGLLARHAAWRQQWQAMPLHKKLLLLHQPAHKLARLQ